MFSNIFKNAICLPSRAFSTGKCFCIDIVCITILFSGERESERETDGNRGREGEMEIRGLWNGNVEPASPCFTCRLLYLTDMEGKKERKTAPGISPGISLGIQYLLAQPFSIQI